MQVCISGCDWTDVSGEESNDKCRRLNKGVRECNAFIRYSQADRQTSPPAIVILINVALSAAHGASSSHLASAARPSVHFVKSLHEVSTMPKISTRTV